MRVLVVENYENTGLGQVGAALREAGAAIDLCSPYRGQPLPEGLAHDALVVLGGGQNALADAEYPYLPALLDLLRGYALAERPMLGICLGSQLMARAFGGANQIGGATEFGWSPVALTEAGRADPVLGAVPETFRPFQWHDDTFSLPPGAVRLAAGDRVENQAFRIGRAGYGIQFHFEADRRLVEEWNSAFSDTIAERQPAWAARYAAEAAAHGEQADRAGLALARAWVKLAGAAAGRGRKVTAA